MIIALLLDIVLLRTTTTPTPIYGDFVVTVQSSQPLVAFVSVTTLSSSMDVNKILKANLSCKVQLSCCDDLDGWHLFR